MTTPTKKKPGPKPKTIEYFRSKNAELRRSILSKEKQIDAQIDLLNARDETLANSRQEVSILKERLEGMSSSLDRITGQLKNKIEEVETLMGTVRSLREEKATLVRGATTDLDTIEALKTRVSEIQSHRDCVRNDLHRENGRSSVLLDAIRALGEGLSK